MHAPPAQRRLDFQTKVLIPVITLMTLLLCFTMWAVNRRFAEQLHAKAAETLATANAVFTSYSQQIRQQNLQSEYRNVPKEQRVKQVAELADPKTVRFLLSELLEDFGGDMVLFAKEGGKTLASVALHLQLNLGEFEAHSSVSVQQALSGQPNVDLILVGQKFYDIVSVPVLVGSQIAGALAFATEIGEAVAQEFKQVTHSEIVFVADDSVVISTLARTGADRELAGIFQKLAAGRQPADVVLNGEHFSALAGYFTTLRGTEKLGYLLLSSYEKPLQQLRATQRLLFLISVGGILLSSLIVWVLVRKITQPLRQLRDGAEAVGRGDFSHHVPILSRDECGDLASAFNQMVENLKMSRAQLEKTVETLKTTQAQLVQSEKLSAIGEFVAGVTHELNNPLTAVIGFAELLQQSKIGEQHRRHLEFIVLSAQRCHKIVQSLLSFARQHPPERKWVQLNDLVETTLSFVNYELHTSNIKVIRLLDPLLPKVLADPHQLQQVFLNIINNARQAIEDYRPDGQLRVSTGTVEGRARVTIQDNGPGISAENLSRIFNPFFTTKEVGKGTGLGLSLSYGIIQEHGGTIAVRSQEGEGTAFIIDLPITRDSAGGERAQAGAGKRPALELEGHGRRVLLIDDEESILELAREILTTSGYQVDTALDGEKALQQLQHTQYDLILCDWKMPGLSGQQFYQQLQAASPQTAARVVFMTGDVVNEKTQQFLRQNGKVCLSKPFSLDEFRAAVRTVIEAA